ncbi:SDR family NAD(P)-dependent oxidoreductase [Dactylosporangium sp. CA-092794]|uniref:SDR family NAD(P)-dependent oxidoreductase n=1 Tax=Dactylosporangium sp. CA-092794 TaxID=3239929 RepID=UPI003D8E9C0D
MLNGRVVIVTGGGRGIGRSHCLTLAGLGATVVVNDLGVTVRGERSEETPADSVVAEIVAKGGAAVADNTSVTDSDGIGKLVARTVEQFGRLDAVVNNAGILRDRMITSLTLADFEAVMAVHVSGTFAVTKHACDYWRAMSKAGEPVAGRIVNTTSGTGLFGNIGQSPYGAAKAAIANLTMITAMEMQRYGVTANAISPIAATRMTGTVEHLAGPDGTAGAGGAPGWTPMDPGNSSPVVAWLASEASGWLTGAVLRVDGNKVSRMRPWAVDEDVTYVGPAGRPVPAQALDAGMRAAYGLVPKGLPASSPVARP